MCKFVLTYAVFFKFQKRMNLREILVGSANSLSNFYFAKKIISFRRNYKNRINMFARVFIKSFRTSKVNFILKHINLALGTLLFYFLIPLKVEKIATPFINPTFGFGDDIPYISPKILIFALSAYFFNKCCESFVQTFQRSIRRSLQLLAFYALICLCAFFKSFVELLRRLIILVPFRPNV